MTQTFVPPNPNTKKQKLYCYINNFPKVVIAKIVGLKNRHCERVVFPQEKFLFMADDDCKLELCQPSNASVVRETITCSNLQVVEEQY